MHAAAVSMTPGEIDWPATRTNVAQQSMEVRVVRKTSEQEVSDIVYTSQILEARPSVPGSLPPGANSSIIPFDQSVIRIHSSSFFVDEDGEGRGRVCTVRVDEVYALDSRYGFHSIVSYGYLDCLLETYVFFSFI
ncbi:hypothetical protein WN55_05229 [Dufourea novaeangliae]|uniref:Uncharacterized protein n=1 Tax=Dufourea novaeangliae TaxID=178035 RepID=A0A154PP61_DUFNO|nr:hypothetical protein WN55_05229 [Dufourea novaeangliae]